MFVLDELPLCPTCKKTMRVVGAVPLGGNPPYEQRWYECKACSYSESQLDCDTSRAHPIRRGSSARI